LQRFKAISGFLLKTANIHYPAPIPAEFGNVFFGVLTPQSEKTGPITTVWFFLYLYNNDEKATS